MVKLCHLCKKRYEKTSSCSYHKFPHSHDKRLEWFKMIDLEPNFSENLLLCSDHFLPSDIFLGDGGRKYLKKNALPVNTVVGSETTRRMFTYPEEMVEVVESREDSQSSSPSTDTATECEDLSESSKSPPKKRLKLKKPRYVGDCSSDDLDSPQKAKQNWALAKRKIEQQKKKIKLLQQRNRRLEKQVVYLKSLTGHLRNENLITEIAEEIIIECD